MVCALISSDLDRLIGKIDLEPERALHDRPFLELECAQAVGDEGIGLGKSARLLRIRSAQERAEKQRKELITRINQADTRLNERSFIPKRMRPDFGAELAAAEDLLAERTRIDERLWRYVAERTLPGQDLDAVLAQSLEKAVGRYVESFRNTPPTGRPVRRVAAFGYNTIKRLSR